MHQIVVTDATVMYLYFFLNIFSVHSCNNFAEGSGIVVDDCIIAPRYIRHMQGNPKFRRLAFVGAGRFRSGFALGTERPDGVDV